MSEPSERTSERVNKGKGLRQRRVERDRGREKQERRTVLGARCVQAFSSTGGFHLLSAGWPRGPCLFHFVMFCFSLIRSVCGPPAKAVRSGSQTQ